MSNPIRMRRSPRDRAAGAASTSRRRLAATPATRPVSFPTVTVLRSVRYSGTEFGVLAVCDGHRREIVLHFEVEHATHGAFGTVRFSRCRPPAGYLDAPDGPDVLKGLRLGATVLTVEGTHLGGALAELARQLRGGRQLRTLRDRPASKQLREVRDLTQELDNLTEEAWRWLHDNRDRLSELYHAKVRCALLQAPAIEPPELRDQISQLRELLAREFPSRPD